METMTANNTGANEATAKATDAMDGTVTTSTADADIDERSKIMDLGTGTSKWMIR